MLTFRDYIRALVFGTLMTAAILAVSTGLVITPIALLSLFNG